MRPPALPCVLPAYAVVTGLLQIIGFPLSMAQGDQAYDGYNPYDSQDPNAANDPQDPNDPNHYSNNNNYANYGFDYGAAGGYEYSVDEGPASIQCYSCHFWNEGGHEQGQKECHTPFVGTVIPEVTCEGPCGKVYRTLSDQGEYMVSRNCMQNCKELSDADGHTECCSTDLCNAATSTSTSSHWTVIVTCALLTAVATVVQHLR